MYAKKKRASDFSKTLASYFRRLELNSNRIQYHPALPNASIIGVGFSEVIAKYTNITTDTTNNNADTTASASIILFLILFSSSKRVQYLVIHRYFFAKGENKKGAKRSQDGQRL